MNTICDFTCSSVSLMFLGMGDGPIFLKTIGPLSLMTIYRMSQASARFISLDRTFKEETLEDV
jgi:hypothetical protein